MRKLDSFNVDMIFGKKMKIIKHFFAYVKNLLYICKEVNMKILYRNKNEAMDK